MNTDLLDWAERRARRSDPSTSKHASQDIKRVINERCQQFLTGLMQLGRATANEVALHVSGDNRGMHDSIRRRASDLVAMGLIRKVGVRPCAVTGKCVSEYEVAE